MLDNDDTERAIQWRGVRSVWSALAMLAAIVVTIVWAATGAAFWPVWVWLGLAVPFMFRAALRSARSAPRRWRGPARPTAPSGRRPGRAVGRRRGDPDGRVGLDRRGLLAVLAAVRAGRRARLPRPDRGHVEPVAPRPARAGARAARRRAHPHAARSAGRAGGRAAADRARP